MKLVTKSPEPPVLETPETKIAEVISVQPQTLLNLVEKSRAIAEQCEDFTIEGACTSNLRFNDHAGLTYIPTTGDIRDSEISRYALGQLGAKIGVPATYLEKCVSSGRISLAQDNVNSWLETYGKDLFIREYQGRVRGVLSSRYSVCDSHEILDVVTDAVDLSAYEVKGSYLSEERLHARLVSKEKLPIDGEDLFAGLFIDSSDVGRSLLTVHFGIYKLVCTNGLVISRAGGTLFRQKHIGITSSEFHDGLIASLQNVDYLIEHACEWVRATREKKLWGYDLMTMGDEGHDELVQRIRSQLNLPESGANKVIALMKSKYGGTQWGFINSITEVAQDFTLERRLDLERVAGNLLVA